MLQYPSDLQYLPGRQGKLRLEGYLRPQKRLHVVDNLHPFAPIDPIGMILSGLYDKHVSGSDRERMSFVFVKSRALANKDEFYEFMAVQRDNRALLELVRFNMKKKMFAFQMLIAL